MITNVRRAFTCSGVLKSGTLSEIASIPVSEALPLAKAFKIRAVTKIDEALQRVIFLSSQTKIQ